MIEIEKIASNLDISNKDEVIIFAKNGLIRTINDKQLPSGEDHVLHSSGVIMYLTEKFNIIKSIPIYDKGNYGGVETTFQRKTFKISSKKKKGELTYVKDSKNNLTFHEPKKKGGEKTVDQPKNIGLITAGKTYRAAKRQARKTYKEVKAQAKIVRINAEKQALNTYNLALKTNGKPANNTKKTNGTGTNQVRKVVAAGKTG